jgi:hypothetical protein
VVVVLLLVVVVVLVVEERPQLFVYDPKVERDQMFVEFQVRGW